MTVWPEESWQAIVGTLKTKIISIEEGYAVFNDQIKPMVGVIGIALADEEVPGEVTYPLIIVDFFLLTLKILT